jgi:hypothetical protein
MLKKSDKKMLRVHLNAMCLQSCCTKNRYFLSHVAQKNRYFLSYVAQILMLQKTLCRDTFLSFLHGT